MKYLMDREDATAHGLANDPAETGHAACGEGMRGRGLFPAAAAIRSVPTSITLPVRSGRSSCTDGPFVETKE